MLNNFTNPNAQIWYKWLFSRRDELKCITIYFLSKIYPTSPRNFPLLNSTTSVRIVVINGSRFRGIDRFIQRLIPFFYLLIKKRLCKYKVLVSGFENGLLVNTNQIVLFDDPTYTLSEKSLILKWNNSVTSSVVSVGIVCTSDFTKKYLRNLGINFEISVIPQGHGSLLPVLKSNATNENDDLRLKLVYCSPYIDISGDKNAGSPTWDSTLLLEEIWPKLNLQNRFELNLIGRLGRNALQLSEMSNVKIHGLQSINRTIEILNCCDVGIYPRKHDNQRQAQKIAEYLGAGLAVVTFKSKDSDLVGLEGIGIEVNSVSEFIAALDLLASNKLILSNYKSKSISLKPKYSWKNLATSLDEFIYSI